MPLADKTNQNFMKLIRGVHSLVITDDLDKNRNSQDNIGRILGTRSREATYTGGWVGDIPTEWVCVNRPHSKKKVILYCHGGGYFTGSLHYARLLTTKLAQYTSLDVLSFDYRLAPEHPYPAALTDAVAVWNDLMLQGYGSRDVLVMGDSAGGNLALALGLKLKEEGRFLPGGFVCLSPWLDLTLSGVSYKERQEMDPILTGEYLEKARNAYTNPEKFADPMVSPLFGDFTGFPPVCIQVGENEMLFSDAVEVYRKMKRENVDVHLERYKGMWHVFQMGGNKTAVNAIEAVAGFVYDKM